MDERDIAPIAAAALLQDRHEGQACEITGPESLTQIERVGILGEVLGRPLRFEELPPDAMRQRMHGVPPAVVDGLLAMMARQVCASAKVTQDVERVLGRAANPYRQWAAGHAADFRGLPRGHFSDTLPGITIYRSAAMNMRLGEEVIHDLMLRLRRIEGQVRGVQRMLEEGRDCGEVVHQVTAARVALAKVAMTIVSENLQDCLAATGDERDDALRRAKRAILDLV